MLKQQIWPLNKLIFWLFLLEVVVTSVFVLLFYVQPDFLEFIEWNSTHYIVLYVLSPLLSLVFIYNSLWKTKSLLNWHETITKDSFNEKDVSFGRIYYMNSLFKFVLIKLSVILLILAIIGPKSGGEMQETTSEGVELIIALDVSKSMLAEDVLPNRLYTSKRAIHHTIEQLNGDLVGLVVFAGHAYTQMPLSNDYASALAYLENVNTSTVQVQGTNISEAIQTCTAGFNYESNASKIVLFFTDGEDHEEQIEEAILEAKEKGVKISCIAVGSDTGAPIPDFNSDQKYKKDAQGNTVISKVNVNLLEQISSQGGGFFTHLKSSRPTDIKEILEYINHEQTAETGNFAFIDLTPRYRIPLCIALMLLIGSLLIKEKKPLW